MRTLTLTIALLALTAAGCSSQQYGECEAPDDHLKVMFKPKNAANPFSHSFCIVCNPGLSPEEHVAWAIEMGAPTEPENSQDKLPCLYVYAPEDASGNGSNSLKQCKSWVCDGGAQYSDLVSEKNGNFNLEKLLNGEVNTSFEMTPINAEGEHLSQPIEEHIQGQVLKAEPVEMPQSFEP